jgi:perosamine synthetase
MSQKKLQRRSFIRNTTIASASLSLYPSMVMASEKVGASGKPAVLGGKQAHPGPFPSWPMPEKEDDSVWLDVLHQKGWCRLDGEYVNNFEKAYAKMMGVKDCIATSNGTNALFGSLSALEIGPGDEVIVPPYTFVATINVPFLLHALPVFVDSDPETFQIDATKIEEKITDRTRAICPVHLGGNVANMDKVMAVAKKHNIPVIEDACQSHLAEWKGNKVGSVGNAGCFSFQVTKNLSSGEGGAIISNDTKLMDRIFSFHSNGRERVNKYGFNYLNNGINMRMTEFQGALLLQGMKRLEKQAKLRETNAEYLTQNLKQIDGIEPAKMYDGTTRNAYHLYMLRYNPEGFSGLPRSAFINAMRKEGVSCGGGYSPLNKEPLIEKTVTSRPFKSAFSDKQIKNYLDSIECPKNDQLCSEAVWMFQSMLLGSRRDMDQIIEAVHKIRKNAEAIKRL